MFVLIQPESSVVFVCPRTTAPAARRLPTTFESPAGIELCRATEPSVVGSPATSTSSLTSTGRPSSGPRAWAPARAAPGARAGGGGGGGGGGGAGAGGAAGGAPPRRVDVTHRVDRRPVRVRLRDPRE